MNKKKVAKIFARIGTGIAALALGLAGAYFLTPNRVNVVDLNETEEVNNGGENHFQDFVNNYMGVVTGGLNGMHAEFENFNVTFKTQDDFVENSIDIDGFLDVTIENLLNLDLNLNAMLNVTYNNKETVPVTVAYVDNVAYLRFMDFGLKADFMKKDELVDFLVQYFGEGTALNIDIPAIDKQVFDYLNKTLSITNLINMFTGSGKEETPSDGTGFSFSVLPETKLSNGGFIFHIKLVNTAKVVDVPASEEVEEVSHLEDTVMLIDISCDENFNATRIDLSPSSAPDGIKFGNFKIKGALNIHQAEMTVLPPDDPSYGSTFQYVEVAAYKGWLIRLSELLGDNDSKMSLTFDADITADKEDPDTHAITEDFYNVGRINGILNLDASNLIDLSKWQYGYVEPENTDETEPAEEGPEKIDTGNETFNKLLDGLKLGFNVKLFDSDDNQAANLDLIYADQAGYLTLNEYTKADNSKDAALKAKIDAHTVNWLISSLPKTINDITDEINDIISRFDSVTHVDSPIQEEDASGLFDFITDSEFMTAIKQGDFSSILDLIETFTNNAEEKQINLVLNLAPLGFGDDAKVGLLLDADEEQEVRVMTITAQNIKFAGAKLNLTLINNDYTAIEIGNPNDYDSLSFLPTVADQVTGILQEKQVALDVEATIMNPSNEGFEIIGETQFDYNKDGANKGFGTLTLNQYKGSKKYVKGATNKNVWYSHKVLLDIDNNNEDPTTNMVKFVYGDLASDNIKGYFTMQTVYDVIKSFKTLMNDTDERYTKFTDSMAGGFISGTVGDIIESKNYFRLANNDFIKEVRLRDNGKYLNIIIGKDILDLNSDIHVKVNFKDATTQEIESIELLDFQMGQNDSINYINAKITLKDYNPSKVSGVPAGTSGFYDLRSISTLLQFGINTTKLNYYEISGSLDIEIAAKHLSFIKATATIPVKVYIDVNGSEIKAYGTVSYSDVGLIGAATHTGALALDSLNSEFTFHTFDRNDPAHAGNLTGGYIDIKKTIVAKTGALWWADKETRVSHYRTTSDYFLDGGELTTYLLDDLLDIDSSSFSDLLGGGEEEKDPGKYTQLFAKYEDGDSTSYGYSYNSSAKSWHIGLYLGNLLAIDNLKALTLDIDTQNYKFAGDEEAKTYLKSAQLKLIVEAAGIVKITVEGKLTLQNLGGSWGTSLQNKFNALVNISDSAFSSLKDASASIGY